MAQTSFFVGFFFVQFIPKMKKFGEMDLIEEESILIFFLDCNITNSFNVACTPQGASKTNLWSPKNNTIKDVCSIGKVFSLVTVVDKEAKRVTCKTVKHNVVH